MNSVVNLTPARRDAARWSQSRLLDWFNVHGREFAWRSYRDPYAILLAELMLHRTQARQVEPVFLRFMERFPTLQILTEAEEKHVMQVLSPLGLEWRLAKIMPL